MSIDNPTTLANLGLTLPLAVASGGTSATSTSAALTTLGLAVPMNVSGGGTSATTTSGALTALGTVASTVGMQKISVPGVSSAASFTLPVNSYIEQIFVKNNTANAVTGGLKFGSSSGAADIVAALVVAGSVISPPATMLLTKFSAAQTIFVDAVAAWNSANVDLTVVYGQL